MVEESKKYDYCMSLDVSQDGRCVELLLDTSLRTYHEWIPGEGGDIGLIRSAETKRVVGIVLPLIRNNLAVFHDGPLKINEGFLKPDEGER